MKLRALLTWSIPVLVSAALINCTSAGSEPQPQQCEEISSLCHAAEEMSADAASCHEEAHAGDADVCSQIYDDCIALCEDVLGIGGAGGEGGAGGTTH